MLCGQENSTFVALSLDKLGLDRVLGVAGRNEIVGEFGKCIDGLLIKKALRKCRILGIVDIGEKLANSTYTGVLGMLQSKKADLYLRGEPDYLHENWLTKSMPIQMESIVVGQVVPDQKTLSFFNLLDNFKLGFSLSAAYLFSFFTILAFSFLIDQLGRRIRFAEDRRTVKLSKRIDSTVSSFWAKRLSAIGVFVLFMHLFLWITQLFLTNNIKTNKVVVDTSQLIKDERDLLNTRRVACIEENDQLTKMMAGSPSQSILWKLYEKTRLRKEMILERELIGKDRCLLSRDYRMAKLLESDIFVAGGRSVANVLLGTVFVVEGIFKKLWISEKSVYEFNNVFYYNGDKPGIGKAIMRSTEHGLAVRMQGCIDKAGRAACRNSNITLLENLSDYVREHSDFSDLGYHNFRFIFLYYTIICSLVLVAFCGSFWLPYLAELAAICLHHLVRLAKKVAISIGSLLRDCFTRLAFALRKVARHLAFRIFN